MTTILLIIVSFVAGFFAGLIISAILKAGDYCDCQFYEMALMERDKEIKELKEKVAV